MALPNALNPGSRYPARNTPPPGYPPLEEVPGIIRELGWPNCCTTSRPCGGPTINGIHYQRSIPSIETQERCENEVLKAWMAKRPIAAPPRRELPRSQRMKSLPSLRELTR